MKTILLATVLLFTILTTQAQQPWAVAGATWHYSVQGYAREGYTKLTNIGDTAINGKTCNVLEKYTEVYDFINQNTTTETTLQYTYADSSKVYYYVNNHFGLLYDFSITAGSVWLTEFDTTNSVQNCNQYLDTVMVDSVKTEVINGDSLRKLYVHVTRNNYTYNDQIVEKIGSSIYMFPTPSYCNAIVESSTGPLRCYADSAGFNYQTNPSTWGYYGNATTPCNFVTATAKLNTTTDNITTFPNPTTTSLTINTTANINVVRMYNALGQQVVHNVYTTGTNSQTIPVYTLPHGMYILQVTTDNNNISTTKVVVQ